MVRAGRKKSRGGRRGAALVESLVVISVMVVFFWGMVYFQSIFHQKLQVQALSRSANMFHAVNACGGTPIDYIRTSIGRANATSANAGTSFAVSSATAPQLGISSQATAANWIVGADPTLEQVNTTDIDIKNTAGFSTQDGMTKIGLTSNIESDSFSVCGEPVPQPNNFPDVVQNITVSSPLFNFL
jgi:hypothetical protein